MGRRIVFAAIAGLVFYILRSIERGGRKSEYIPCEKCDGKGYWIATKGEKDKCDRCKGSGKVLR